MKIENQAAMQFRKKEDEQKLGFYPNNNNETHQDLWLIHQLIGQIHGHEFESQRYRITINVIQGDCNARVTLFDQAAEVYVGCSVDEYISSIKEGETDSTYYRGLSTQAYTEMRFMTMLKSIKFDQRGNLNIVANAIQKTQPIESIDVGDIEEEPTEVEEKKYSPEKSKKKIPSRRKKSTTELQPTQKKKRRITKKKFDDYIDITSDDDLPLNNIMLQTKNKKKRSPIVKIKQENI